MILKKIRLKNFMPYKGEHSIDLDFSPDRNVFLIFGDNMRGKTSLLNAIRWAFFGTAMGRHLRSVPTSHLVNIEAAKEGDWNTFVHVEFEANDRIYDLRREVGPKELIVEPTEDAHFDLNLGLRRDGRPLRSDEIRHELNQIMPEDISRFFLFDGELLQEYEMLLIEASDQGSRIKEAIEQVLGVPAVTNGRNELRGLLKEAQKTQARESRHIRSLQAQAEQQLQLQAKRESLEKSLRGLQAKKEQIEREIDAIEQELDSTAEVEKAKGALDAYRREREELKERQDSLIAEKLLLLREAWKDLLQPRLRAQIADLAKERGIILEHIEQRGALRARVQALQLLLSGEPCPTCTLDLQDAEVRERLGSELGQLEGQLDAFGPEIERLSVVTTELDSLSKLQAEGTAGRLSQIEREIRHLGVRIIGLEAKIENLKARIESVDTAEIARNRAKLEQLYLNLGSLKRDIGETDSEIGEVTRKQNQLARLLSKNPEARNRRASRLVSTYSSLDRVFSESVELFRDQLRERVAARASWAFAELTTDESLKELTINENYGLKILDQNGEEVPERSAGAEQIVALSLIDALNRTARKTGPLVMDTPLARLDPSHRENVLAYLPKMADQIILLVHEGEISMERDLASLKDRVASIFKIEYVTSSHSRIVRQIDSRIT